MTNATGRTPIHNPLGASHLTITLMVCLVLGTNSVASQTSAASDSTRVAASDWALKLTGSKADTVVTRHFVSPSAFQLKKGEGHFQSNLIVNVASLGLSEHVSASCILGGPFVRGLGMGVKTSHSIGGKTRWSLGGLVATKPAGGPVNMPTKPFAMGFTTLSFGNPDKNVSLSVGLTNRAFRGRSTFYVYSGEEREVAQMQQDELLDDDIDLFGAKPTSIFTDAKGHQGQIVIEAGTLVWLASIYGDDLSLNTYDTDFSTDLHGVAFEIMSNHPEAYKR